MKLLVVGLGSMGKRRIRNLRALGQLDIAGYDPRADRRAEASGKYGIAVFDSYAEALESVQPEVMIISTGPAQHMEYAFDAVERGVHCFVEASVVDEDRIRVLDRRIAGTGLVVAPSCTMRYFPAPRLIRQLIEAGHIGKPLNLNYHVGQYLPDWHPWEDIADFYVSQRDTGGARELLPFELTWLSGTFGEGRALACVKTKLSEIAADIDDIYHCVVEYPGALTANVTIDVLSRPRPTREFRLLGSEGLLTFSSTDNCVRWIRVGDADWTVSSLEPGTVEDGYVNPEEPYIREISDFLRAVAARNPALFPNTLADDASVLRLMNELETLSPTMA